MIIPVSINDQELRIKLNYGDMQVTSIEGLRLVVVPAPRKKCVMDVTKWNWEGCWDESAIVPRRDVGRTPDDFPALVYPAFETDDHGWVVFRLDKKLTLLPPGRYHGRIERGHAIIQTVDLDLWAGPWTVGGVATVSASCGA